MAYITRELERKFLKLNDFFKVILVTGARQVGKTTMLKHLAESSRTYVTMDNTMARELAQSDPVLFFQTYKPPVLIDEVQKAPELFEQIKIICDESDEKGLIWLTGSQQYNMMKKVQETLAGRIGILELYSLSAREKAGFVFDTDLDFSLASLQARQQKVLTLSATPPSPQPKPAASPMLCVFASSLLDAPRSCRSRSIIPHWLSLPTLPRARQRNG